MSRLVTGPPMAHLRSGMLRLLSKHRITLIASGPTWSFPALNIGRCGRSCMSKFRVLPTYGFR